MRSTRILTILAATAASLCTVEAARAQAPGGAPVLDSAFLAGYSWRNIGPDRGGRSIAVSGVRGRPGIAYFGAVGGGLWKTTDSGVTWKPVTDGQITSASVGAVAVSFALAAGYYLGYWGIVADQWQRALGGGSGAVGDGFAAKLTASLGIVREQIGLVTVLAAIAGGLTALRGRSFDTAFHAGLVVWLTATLVFALVDLGTPLLGRLVEHWHGLRNRGDDLLRRDSQERELAAGDYTEALGQAVMATLLVEQAAWEAKGGHGPRKALVAHAFLQRLFTPEEIPTAALTALALIVDGGDAS